MTKLKFFIDKKGKQYTLKDEVRGRKTEDAHYKYLKLKDAPRRQK